MAGKNKYRRITLRLDLDFQTYLRKLAKDMGIGLNDLMNLLLRRASGNYQVVSRERGHYGGGKKRKLFSLRMDDDLNGLIQSLGREKNGLITEMLHFALPPLHLERRVYMEYVLTGRYKALFREWKKGRARATPNEFDAELRRLLAGEPSSLSGLETPSPASPIPHPAPNPRLPDFPGF
jgi:hypothetical protein